MNKNQSEKTNENNFKEYIRRRFGPGLFLKNLINNEDKIYIFGEMMKEIKDTELISKYASQIKKLTKEIVKIAKSKDDFRRFLYAVMKTELLRENFPDLLNIIDDMEKTEDKCRAFDELLTYGLRDNDLLKESYLSLLNIVEEMENVDCKVTSFRFLLDKMNDSKLLSKVLPRIEAITGDIIGIIKDMSNANQKVNVSESLHRTLKKTRIKILNNFALQIKPSIRDKIKSLKDTFDKETDSFYKVEAFKSLLEEIKSSGFTKDDFMALLSVIKDVDNINERFNLFHLLLNTIKNIELEFSKENFRLLLKIIKDFFDKEQISSLLLDLKSTKLFKMNFIIVLKVLKEMDAIRGYVFNSLHSDLIWPEMKPKFYTLKKKFNTLLNLLVFTEDTLYSPNESPNPDIIYQISDIIDIVKDINDTNDKFNAFKVLLYLLKITRLLDNFFIQIETWTENLIHMVKDMEDYVDKFISFRHLMLALKESNLLNTFSSSIEKLVLDCIEVIKNLKERQSDLDRRIVKDSFLLNRSPLGGVYEFLIEAIQDTYLWEKYHAQISRIVIIEGFGRFDYEDILEMKEMFDDYEYQGSVWKIYSIAGWSNPELYIIANRKPTVRQLKKFSPFFDFLEYSDKNKIRRTYSSDYEEFDYL